MHVVFVEDGRLFTKKILWFTDIWKDKFRYQFSTIADGVCVWFLGEVLSLDL